MTPHAFIKKWQNNPLNERASYQLHFIDLCALVGVPTPSPETAETYCFERGATKTGAGQGWADVWKKGFFGFEYKATRRDLGEALKQLMTYALALDNPPLLVVCDTSIIQIHTHFTNAPSEVHTILLADIGEPENLEKLRWLFTDPNKFHPKRTIAEITEKAARKFAELAQSLNSRHDNPHQVAHFLNQCLFCLFAEDAQLLPEKLFERVLEKSTADPERLERQMAVLFNSMREGGDFGADDIAWFNGGLFNETRILRFTPAEIKTLYEASQLDWSGIEPSIFGTLFERGLDPSKRSQLGAHYTDPKSIMRLINPVIVEPLQAEWAEIKTQIESHLAKSKRSNDKAYQNAHNALITYLERLKNFRVLDPACGSGNFLYLALRALKDLEHRANLDAEALGLHRQVSIGVSPANVLGIELNTYASELARVVVWIGEIQWALKHGYAINRNPILQSLDHIENRDAVLNTDGTEAEWTAVDAIVGNPPFLGGQRLRSELGDTYTATLRACYDGRVAGGADLVVYWFEKAREHIGNGKCQRVGLVSTQSIRKGANQKVLARICDTTKIFDAWSDEEWINEGASVRVSLVCFGNVANATLDGQPVETIHADLTAGSNLTQAILLQSNAGIAFQGPVKVGAFDVNGVLAREWLKQPNPNGKPSSEVIRPWANGMDITRRPSDTWIIDFGQMSEEDASYFQEPFALVKKLVKPMREAGNSSTRKKYWWRHGASAGDMKEALANLPRYILTPRVSKYRLFGWLNVSVLPDSRLYAIARDDDATFGVLSSRIHEVWALANASKHGVGNDPTYNAKSCFETFPFPQGLTPNLAPEEYDNSASAEVAETAKKINQLRENWLNPPEWVEWERTPEEERAGYPARPVAKAGHEAELKKRTLTNLYNLRPTWLDNAHKVLDMAVAKAYGWNDYTPEMSDEEILRRLLTLNLSRG